MHVAVGCVGLHRFFLDGVGEGERITWIRSEVVHGLGLLVSSTLVVVWHLTLVERIARIHALYGGAVRDLLRLIDLHVH